jgi:hypothetical protein
MLGIIDKVEIVRAKRDAKCKKDTHLALTSMITAFKLRCDMGLRVTPIKSFAAASMVACTWRCSITETSVLEKGPDHTRLIVAD